MSTLITILHAIVSLFLILTILLQSGKGGGMGGAFGGSNSGTVFGGSGASTFLRKLTATAATIFMSTSIILAFLASHDSSDALEKFGRSQADLAKKKEEAKEKALLDGAGSNAGSGAATMGLPGLETPTTPPPAVNSDGLPIDTGSAAPTPAPAAGSATATPASGSSSGTVATPPPAKATGTGTAAGNATTVDPNRTGSAGIGLPNTPGVAPKTAPKAPAPKTESTTPSTTPAPAAKDTTGTNNATGSAAPAESSPNAPK